MIFRRRQEVETAVSPVIAVILMVAVTVILSAVVGTFAFGLTDSTANSTNANAGVSITPNEDGTVSVLLTDSGTADSVVVRNEDGDQATLTQVGDSETLATYGEPVTVLAEKDGEQVVLQSHTPSASTVAAYTIDTFDDSGYDEYTEVGTATFVVDESGPTRNGGSLKITDDNDASHAGIESSSGLNRYPKAGDTWEVWTYIPNEPKPVLHTRFAVQDNSNFYDVTHQARDDVNEFRLRKMEGGTVTNVDVVSFDYSEVKGSWVRTEVQWQSDGTMTATLYDEGGTQLAQASGTDTTYTEGGVRWAFNNPGASSVSSMTAAFDEITVTGSAD